MNEIFLRHFVRFQRLETLYSPSTMKNKTAEKSFKKKKECLKENKKILYINIYNLKNKNKK